MEANWGTLGMLYKDTLDSLELYLSHTTKTHYFIGFNALNKAEQDLIQGFLVEKKGAVIGTLIKLFTTINFMPQVDLSVIIKPLGLSIVKTH